MMTEKRMRDMAAQLEIFRFTFPADPDPIWERMQPYLQDIHEGAIVSLVLQSKFPAWGRERMDQP